MNIFFILIGFAVGGLIPYFYFKPKLAVKVKQDTAILKEKEETEAAIKSLNKEKEAALVAFNLLNSKIETAKTELNSLNENIKTATEQFHSLSVSLEEMASSLYEHSKQMAETKIKTLQLLLQRTYEVKKQQLTAEYQLMENEIAEKKNALQQSIEESKDKLDELTSKVHSALEAARRQKELESDLDFYRVVLSPEDENEIKVLLSIEYLLSNKRALRMLIWTNYYSKRVNELAARVLGADDVCGIYKITNIETQQIYIGQSRSIKERIREHCKFGLGIDSPGNRLYANMQKYGLSNFTFELMEKCSREKLDERERHWINFYQSNNNLHGLNSTKGNEK